MSFDDTNGSTLLITPGSQSRRASATARLFSPDQLMKTFTDQKASLRFPRSRQQPSTPALHSPASAASSVTTAPELQTGNYLDDYRIEIIEQPTVEQTQD